MADAAGTGAAAAAGAAFDASGTASAEAPARAAAAASAAGPRVAWLLAVHDNGNPLMWRVHGMDKPPIATIGLVAGLHRTGDMLGQPVRLLESDDGSVAIKQFRTGMLLAVVTSKRGAWSNAPGGTVRGDEGAAGTFESRLRATLDASHDALVLLLGAAQVGAAQASHREKALKHQLPLLNVVFDHLLLGVDGRGADEGAPDTMALPRSVSHLLHDYVAFMGEQCGCKHVALAIDGAVAAATEEWWTLDSRDIASLLTMHACMPSSTGRDTVVYLPHSLPKVNRETGTETYGVMASRLVTVMVRSGGADDDPLAQRVELLVLVRGLKPSFEDVMEKARAPTLHFAKAVVSACAPARALPTPLHDASDGLLGVILEVSSNKADDTLAAQRRRVVAYCSDRAHGSDAEVRADVIAHRRMLNAFHREQGAGDALDAFVTGRSHSMVFTRSTGRALSVLMRGAVPAHALVGVAGLVMAAIEEAVLPELDV